MSDSVGEILALLHNTAGMVHGDLTTSNLIIQEKNEKLVRLILSLKFNNFNLKQKGFD